MLSDRLSLKCMHDVDTEGNVDISRTSDQNLLQCNTVALTKCYGQACEKKICIEHSYYPKYKDICSFSDDAFNQE